MNKVNLDKRIIDIISDTIKENQEKYPGIPLKDYDNWKEEIIEKFQVYIKELDGLY